jgi:hypothetical protein
MSERTLEILKELGDLYEQQRRFVTLKPSDEPLLISMRELAEYSKRSIRIGKLNDELTQAVQEGG